MRVDGSGSSVQREFSQEEIFGLQEPGALMFGVVWVFLQEGRMEGWLLMEPPGGFASPSGGSYWRNKGLFMRADRLCFWKHCNNDIIVAIIRFSCNSNRGPSPEALRALTF